MLKLIALLVAYAAIATRLMFAIGTPGRRFALSTSTVERRLAAKSRPRQSLLTVLSVSLAIVLAIPFNAIAAVAPGRLLGRTADGAASRYAYDSSPTVLQRREPTALNTLCPEDVRGHLAATRASLSATRGGQKLLGPITQPRTLAEAVGNRGQELVNQVLKGRGALGNLTAAERAEGAKFFRDVATRTKGSNAEAAAQFNRLRADFLEGKTSEVPGYINDFIQRHGL